jgi:DNA repair exonuclease SbcCD nuclease subunit
MEKSANKRWKESGSTLTFKEWIDRENKKNQEFEGNFIPFQGETKVNSVGSDSIKKTIDEAKQDLIDSSGYKITTDKSNVLGLNKGVLVFSTLLIVGSLSFYFYQKYKKK